jgi:hypothetical protein
LQATIILEYSNPKTAKAITNAISPDNTKTPKGLKINTINNNCQVITNIECTEKMTTLIATIDDLLSSTITAEKTLQTINKQKH